MIERLYTTRVYAYTNYKQVLVEYLVYRTLTFYQFYHGIHVLLARYPVCILYNIMHSYYELVASIMHGERVQDLVNFLLGRRLGLPVHLAQMHPPGKSGWNHLLRQAGSLWPIKIKHTHSMHTLLLQYYAYSMHVHTKYELLVWVVYAPYAYCMHMNTTSVLEQQHAHSHTQYDSQQYYVSIIIYSILMLNILE